MILPEKEYWVSSTDDPNKSFYFPSVASELTKELNHLHVESDVRYDTGEIRYKVLFTDTRDDKRYQYKFDKPEDINTILKEHHGRYKLTSLLKDQV